MPRPAHISILAYWYALGLFIVSASIALRSAAPLFDFGIDLRTMPILAFVLCYMSVTGIVVSALPRLIANSPLISTKHIVYLVLLTGALARLLQLGAPTVLEDDYYRYLWDGAVVIAGESPFLYAPLDIEFGDAGGPVLADLAAQAGGVLDRINYPDLRTVYPPAAQAFFALSHLIAPFSLDGWRVVLFLSEIACVIAILLMLAHYGRSPLWIALYWWNPLVIKEIANSVHMEPVLMLPFLIAAVLVLRSRGIWASFFLALAAGVKIWPLLTVAAIWRQDILRLRPLLISAAIVAVVLAFMFWPIYVSGLNETSGFVAFAQNWRASSVMIILTEWMSTVLPSAGLAAGTVPRLILGAVLMCIIASVCLRRANTPGEIVYRMFLIAAAIYLLSPSQTPWYFLWVAPFLCVFPMRGLALASVLLPMHYLFFYLDQRGLSAVYRYGIVWLIWLPVWGVLVFDYMKNRRALTAQTGAL